MKHNHTLRYAKITIKSMPEANLQHLRDKVRAYETFIDGQGEELQQLKQHLAKKGYTQTIRIDEILGEN